MVTIMFSQAIGLSALMFVLEKKEGLLERNSVAGVTTIELILAHVCARIVIMFIQLVLILIVAAFVFSVSLYFFQEMI